MLRHLLPRRRRTHQIRPPPPPPLCLLADASLPPPAILQLPDLLEKLWGFERLLAYGIYHYIDEPSDVPLYESFLETFYISNAHCIGKADDLVHEYLEKDKALASLWEATEQENFPTIPYGETIQEYLSDLLNDAGKERYPFLTYVVYYLTKEAELITEWLRKGYDPSDAQYDLMIDTRNTIIDFAMLKGDLPSVHTAAVLLEVEFLLDRACNGNLDPTGIYDSILGHALDYLSHKLCAFECHAERVTSAVEVNQLTGLTLKV